MKRRSRKVRKHRDWVYRPNSSALAAPLVTADGLGTYEFQVRALSSGITGSQVIWLVDAQNRDYQIARTTASGGGILSGEARPAVARRKIVMVEGQIYIEPSSWAIGNLIAFGTRIGAFEQDQITGLASLDADYTMWQAAAVTYKASYWANDRQQNLWERRTFIPFSDNGNAFSIRLRARVPWSLQPSHGLGLYLECESTSVNVRYQTWIRTLVEGA